MQIKIGTDLLNKKRFLTSCQNGGDNFLEKIFTPYERRENSLDQLASIFCLKEAVVKALVLPPGSWLFINTLRLENGKLGCTITHEDIARKITSFDTSISHEEKMIIAVVVIIMENREDVPNN